MTTVKEFLESSAKRAGMLMEKAFDGDYDLKQGTKDVSTLTDFLVLAAELQEAGLSLTFVKGEDGVAVVHVHAPHRKEHSWGDRGWDCSHLSSIEECEVNKSKEKYVGWSKKKLREEREKFVQMRDMCVGTLYRDVNQGNIDELDAVLRTMP